MLLPRVNFKVLSIVSCLNPRVCKVYIFVLSDEVNLNNLGFVKSQFIFTAVLLWTIHMVLGVVKKILHFTLNLH